MEVSGSRKMTLGINGFGRIGKLTLWHHVGRKVFDKIVVNIGREVGKSLEDIAHYIERDSTYGPLHGYLYGHSAKRVITEVDDTKSTMVIDGIKVKVLSRFRNPREIGWGEHGVNLVVDATRIMILPYRRFFLTPFPSKQMKLVILDFHTDSMMLII